MGLLSQYTANASSNVAQSVFAGHLIARPERIYPTPNNTGRGSWNERIDPQEPYHVQKQVSSRGF